MPAPKPRVRRLAGSAPAALSGAALLAATAMLHGIVCEELSPAELDVHDPDYPVTVCAVARR